jgi:membrane protein implicated in regulation of membrane protease activity
MSFLRSLKKLILGETWLLPLGVGAVVAVCAVARSPLGDVWHDAGGFLLLAGVVIVLGASVTLSARSRR